jgi:hypothetical protein
MSALSTPIHEQLEQKKKRRREKQGAQPNDKKLKKSQNISFEMSKTWSPKTWATARRNQVKQS